MLKMTKKDKRSPLEWHWRPSSNRGILLEIPTCSLELEIGDHYDCCQRLGFLSNCKEHFRFVLSYAVVIKCVWPHTTFSTMRTWLITVTSREQEWTSWCVSGKSFSSEKAPDHRPSCPSWLSWPSWPSWPSWHGPRADKLRYQPRLLINLL